MDGREIEARMLMWAVAEISWEDASGQHCQPRRCWRTGQTSGACVRLTRPVAVGSVVTIRWQREQFSAWRGIAAGMAGEFVIGVRREAESGSPSRNSASRETCPGRYGEGAATIAPPQNDHPLLLALHAERERRRDQQTGHADRDYQHCACAHLRRKCRFRIAPPWTCRVSLRRAVA